MSIRSAYGAADRIELDSILAAPITVFAGTGTNFGARGERASESGSHRVRRFRDRRQERDASRVHVDRNAQRDRLTHAADVRPRVGAS